MIGGHHIDVDAVEPRDAIPVPMELADYRVEMKGGVGRLTQRQDVPRPTQLHLTVEITPAGVLLIRGGSALRVATHCISGKHPHLVDAYLFQFPPEQDSSRAAEGPTLFILSATRSFTNDHDLRRLASKRDRTATNLVQLAVGAREDLLFHLCKGEVLHMGVVRSMSIENSVSSK